MTEAEIIELIYMNIEAIASNVMNITTIFFAYVICAFLVGKKLNRSWSALVSACYTIFLIAPFSGSIKSFRRSGAIFIRSGTNGMANRLG